MCLALPMKVIRMEDSTALCESRNGIERMDTMLTGPLEAGQWILGFLGAAREVIDAERAAQVEEALYAMGSEVESNTVEVYVSRLRKKLERPETGELIRTVRGEGYLFTVKPQPA